MKTLLRSTTAYRLMGEDVARATLIIFPDAKYLRALLKECAARFFGAGDARRDALIASESFSDCHILPTAGGKLTADDAAYMIDESLLRPVEEDKKLFVLDSFDLVTPLVQNKLLKLIEEPPDGVYFLLGATGEGAVLPTVLSRVRRIAEPPFSEEHILSALQREGRTGRLAGAAAACGGVYSLAEALLSDGEDFSFAERLMAGQDLEGLEAVDKRDKDALFAALTLTVRDMLLYKTGFGRYASLTGESLQRLASGYAEGALLAAAEFIKEAQREVRFNANLSQCMYTLGLRIQKENERWKRLSQ